MAIKGWATLLGRRLDRQDPKTLQMHESMLSSIDGMSSLVARLLQYSRVDAGGLHIVKCDTNVLLENVAAQVRGGMNVDEIQITSDPLPVINADETLISQVFQNLVENAVKYRREGTAPVIHVSARTQPDYWEFSFSDNGQGINPADLHRVFDLFERGSQTRRTTSGSGIGLATCKRIVERHGGTIWAESQPGEGSTFRFRIAR
jgi:signal transduction histidine kinase